MIKKYYDQDCNLGLLDGKTVAIIGFGSQGHAHAMNLHESGANVVVGLRPGSAHEQKALNAGLKVMGIEEAAEAGDIVMMLTPDELQAKIYKEQIEKQITLSMFYPTWLKHKALHTEATSYVHRIDNDWYKYYVGTAIVDKPLCKLDKVTLDEWAHELIRKHSLTKTQYYNITVIMRQALEYAKEKGIITESPFAGVKVSKKLFKVVKKKPDATQVFLVDEQPKIEAEALQDFAESGYTACLGIALCFQLGARIGEMVALKWSDIGEEKPNHIHIQRMERKVHAEQPDGTWKSAGYEVVEHAKTEAGDRNTYLPKKARDILQTIKDWNVEHGFGDSEYIFLGKDGNRIHSRALDTRIRKYCTHIGIDEKSMHKIRKTYISALVDSNLININKIREMVGHEDERTTLKNYTFNRKSEEQTQEDIEMALAL